MRWIGAIAKELMGLFVDDGGFAISILLWLAAAIFVLPLTPVPIVWRGVVLFAGLAVTLIFSCLRGASSEKP